MVLQVTAGLKVVKTIPYNYLLYMDTTHSNSSLLFQLIRTHSQSPTGYGYDSFQLIPTNSNSFQLISTHFNSFQLISTHFNSFQLISTHVVCFTIVIFE